MRFQAKSSSSAVLVALCTLLMAGCGGGTLSEEGRAGADSSGDALGGSSSRPNTGTAEETEEGEEGEGVTLCHLPPGNPANAHTITVGAPAVKAHLRHGDTLGACEGSTEPDAGTPPTETDAGTPPTEPDAGTPPPTGTDAGTTDPGQTCKGPNETCGNGIVCCAGLVCRSGSCAPDIN